MLLYAMSAMLNYLQEGIDNNKSVFVWKFQISKFSLFIALNSELSLNACKLTPELDSLSHSKLKSIQVW